MEIKSCQINSYGDPVEKLDDAVCIQLKVEAESETNHDTFEVVYDRRMKQLAFGCDTYKKSEEETQPGQKIRLPLEMICLGSNDPEEIKVFAQAMREFADRLEQMIS